MSRMIEELEQPFGGLSITGKKIEASGSRPKLEGQGTEAVEEFIAGKKDYDLQDKSDKFRLKFTRDLNKKQKLAHYLTPDYCMVTRADTLPILRLELDSLVSRGGVYYSIFDKIEAPEDFNK